ncbi:MAG: excinuclease ABC subunit UvrC [Deltaproteobacteria bacterium]|nr:excinuclease ABC subunit UvrC [Deltaproteobacteria bacterium]
MVTEERLANIPALPGVYIMKGRGGEVLYIGKAKSLRSRVRSYFRDTGDTRYSVKFLSAKAEEIDYIVTNNEKEAFLLEDTLLKQHKPRYNIRLKDSKTYVSIKVTVNEKFPRILVTRQIKKDGARYFGPYVSARSVRETIKFIRRIFPLCVCSASVFRNRLRPCLDWQLGLCSAPAVGYIPEDDYHALVNGAIMFLEGRDKEVIKLLKEKMNAASKRLDFEEAGKLRDRIAAIEEMLEEQKVVTHRAVDQDIFAFVRGDGGFVIQTLFIRGGRLVGSGSHFFHETGLPEDELLSSFLAQYYGGERYVPDELIMPARLEDSGVIEEWLTEKKRRKVSLTTPVRGDKLKLLKMAESNALETLRKKAEAKSVRSGLLEELKTRLHLKNTPESIEAFDISNIGGSQAVGAMVTFRDGVPDKGSYRLFKIKGLQGPDDYAMMEQVLSRRYGKAAEEGKALPAPGLILVDGGKGQLNIAVKVIERLGLKGVQVAALAKERPDDLMARVRPKGERVYLPNVKDPIMLKEGSRPDLLLRRVRDEVHRFAISYHRKLRSKITSILDEVPGIGEKKKKALLERFGDIEAIRQAKVEELMEVPGVTEKLAIEIKERLKGHL